jgi:glyoxylase-like metal-dependent hydrolase (beta-lactamase superfamily II)
MDAQPVSLAEFADFERGAVPQPAEVTKGLYIVPVPFPTGAWLSCTLSYFVADDQGAVHIIDTGYDTPAGRQAIADGLTRFGFDRVASVTSTHMHPDHLGLDTWLQSDYGAQIVLHDVEWNQLVAESMVAGGHFVPDLDGWGVPAAERASLPETGKQEDRIVDIHPDVLVHDGDLLPIPGRRLRVLATPGHTPGHISLHEEDLAGVFTGDQVLPHIHPGLGLGGQDGTNPIAVALASLRRIRDLGADLGYPGHEYRFSNLPGRVQEHIDHHTTRAREVAAVITANPDASVWEVASQVHWTAGWEQLKTERFVYSGLQQVAAHREFVLAGGLDSN